MEYDIPGIIKDSVTAMDAAKALGLTPDRHGRCACPFHNGKDRNMKLYPGSGGYHCFVCGESGDVIQLVMGVEGIGFKQAIERLNSVFHLGLQTGRTVSEEAQQAAEIARERRRMEREQREAIERMEFDLYAAACTLVNGLEADKERYRPTKPNEWWHRRFCNALKLLPEARETADRLAVTAIGRRRDG